MSSLQEWKYSIDRKAENEWWFPVPKIKEKSKALLQTSALNSQLIVVCSAVWCWLMMPDPKLSWCRLLQAIYLLYCFFLFFYFIIIIIFFWLNLLGRLLQTFFFNFLLVLLSAVWYCLLCLLPDTTYRIRWLRRLSGGCAAYMCFDWQTSAFLHFLHCI